MHRIRRAALGECKVDVGRQSIDVTIDGSIGVVEWDGSESGPEMLARADHSMYRGKRIHENHARGLTRFPIKCCAI